MTLVTVTQEKQIEVVYRMTTVPGGALMLHRKNLCEKCAVRTIEMLDEIGIQSICRSSSFHSCERCGNGTV